MLYDEINVVFIVDREQHKDKIKIDNNDLEMANEQYYNDVYNALRSFCKTVTVYTNPKDFIKNIDKHKNDVVLSIWSGTKSQNRKGIVPAICEAYGIKYVGADCYVQLLCSNKALTKEYCKKYDISTPAYITVSRRNKKLDITNLKLPLVIKPLNEGGSIGISEDNLVKSYADAEKKCKELLRYYESVMIEEYIDGYELCVILFGNQKEIKVRGASMLKLGDTSYLTDFIWGYEAKKEHNPLFKTTSVDASMLVTEKDWQHFEQLFFDLGKVDLIRVDGRINENGFRLIELSPDAHIGSTASVAKVFSFNNIDYTTMIRELVENAL